MRMRIEWSSIEGCTWPQATSRGLPFAESAPHSPSEAKNERDTVEGHSRRVRSPRFAEGKSIWDPCWHAAPHSRSWSAPGKPASTLASTLQCLPALFYLWINAFRNSPIPTSSRPDHHTLALNIAPIELLRPSPLHNGKSKHASGCKSSSRPPPKITSTITSNQCLSQ